jgi:hypothetical protein
MERATRGEAGANVCQHSAQPKLRTLCAPAGQLVTVMERATSGEAGVDASVKAVLIGAVPDRGGRPEGQRRVADMPVWTARRVSGGWPVHGLCRGRCVVGCVAWSWAGLGVVPGIGGAGWGGVGWPGLVLPVRCAAQWRLGPISHGR